MENMTVLYLLDSSFRKIAVIDTWVSLIWIRRYQDVGEFELYIPSVQAGIFEAGQFIRRADTGSVMMVTDITYTTDEEAGDYCTITGKSLENVLSQRVIWDDTTAAGKAEGVIYRLVERNAISSDALSARRFGFLSLAIPKGLDGEGEYKYSGNNLLDAVIKLCQSSGLGFRIENNVFEVYAGVDRSYQQSNNAYVVFSAKLDNLSSSTYSIDTTTDRNVCRVYSEASDTPYGYVKLVVGTDTGLARREVYYKGQSNAADAVLQEQAATILAQSQVTESFECEVIPTYVYGVDYGLGDIVQYENEYGIKGRARVSEVIECRDETGYTCIPTLENF